MLYDAFVQKLVLAAGNTVRRKTIAYARKDCSAAVFPPIGRRNAWVRYDRNNFPARYRDGVSSPSTVVESRALSARWLQRGFPAARRGPASANAKFAMDSGAVKRRQSRTSSSAWRRPDVRSTFAIYADGSPDCLSRRLEGSAEHHACPSATAPAGNPVEEARKPQKARSRRGRREQSSRS